VLRHSRGLSDAETSAGDPRYPYALTKYLGEQLVCIGHELPAALASVRFFNVYGPRARTTAPMARCSRLSGSVLSGQPLTIVGDGEQTRDFTYVSDAVDALVTVANSDKVGEIYNVGSGRPVSVNELVRLLGSPATVHIPKRPGEPDCTGPTSPKSAANSAGSRKSPSPTGARDAGEYRLLARCTGLDGIAHREATADWFNYLGPEPVQGRG